MPKTIQAERELRDVNAGRVVGKSHPPAPAAGEPEPESEAEATLAVLPTPSLTPPDSASQLEEMDRLLKAVLDNPTAKTISAALAKRPYLKRGIVAFETYKVITDCPDLEKPFFQYFDQVHSLVLEHMTTAADRKREGDGRLWLDFLSRIWPEAYGKDVDHNKPTGVPAIIVIEGRPPRELAPEHFMPTPDDEPDLAA